jgi:hypothetical protein
MIANRFLNIFLVQVINFTMANINILAYSWKRHYEQHPLKHQSNAKLNDIVAIFDHDKAINDGVVEFCNSDDLFGLGCAPNTREYTKQGSLVALTSIPR